MEGTACSRRYPSWAVTVTSPAMGFSGLLVVGGGKGDFMEGFQEELATMLGGKGPSSPPTILQASRPRLPWETDQVLMGQAEMFPPTALKG